MFIYCNEEKIKEALLSKGYRLLKEQNGIYVFANNDKVAFDDKLSNKVMFSNRMTF